MYQLEKHFFLSLFDASSAARITEQCQLLHVEDKGVIFKEGDDADALYLVLQGSVVLSIHSEGHHVVLNEAAADDFFGEFGVIDGGPRSADAQARGPVLLAKIPREVLVRELGNCENSAAIKFMLHTIRKIRQSNARHVEESLRKEKMSILGQLLLGIVHDFRSPFSVIRMAAELIQTGRCKPEDVEESCKLIVEQLDRVNAMAEEVLDYSRGRSNLRIEMVRIHDLLSRFAALNAPYLRSRGIELLAEIQNTCMIMADPGRVQRILQNLVFNAADAMGGREGRIEIVLNTSAHESVSIEVRDNGPGISEEIRERVFEPFQTMGSTKGLGLGLAIARKFAEAHGGLLTFTTQPGKGTTFIIRLPIDGPTQNANMVVPPVSPPHSSSIS